MLVPRFHGIFAVGAGREQNRLPQLFDSLVFRVTGEHLFCPFDAGTAFEFLSIDIADVDVGRNIGAALLTDQAEADKRIAQAKAEQRRAMAVAKEQEMKAYTQEMKAKVVEAEAQVPTAMAEALRIGNLGVMDYYRMNNINADTKMRASLSGEDTPDKKE